MRNNELRRKETVESQSEKKSSSNPQESSSTIYDRAKKGVGIAFAGALKAAEATLKVTTVGLAVQAGLGLDRAHALPQSNASDTALAHRDRGNATAQRPGLDQGFSNLSNQTNLERSLRKVTPEELKQMGVKNPERFIRNVQLRDQNLQQREQKREQRQEVRQLVEEAQKNPKVLESLRKLFEEMPEQKSHETDRRKLDVVGPKPCLQDGVPPSGVKATGVPVEGGGTALTVAYSLSTINTCQDTISNVQFQATELYTCPAGCTQQSGAKDISAEGVPSSIGQGIIATGSPTDTVYCMQTDANGGETPTVPTSLTVTFWPEGVRNGGVTQGTPITRNVYP